MSTIRVWLRIGVIDVKCMRQRTQAQILKELQSVKKKEMVKARRQYK